LVTALAKVDTKLQAMKEAIWATRRGKHMKSRIKTNKTGRAHQSKRETRGKPTSEQKANKKQQPCKGHAGAMTDICKRAQSHRCP